MALTAATLGGASSSPTAGASSSTTAGRSEQPPSPADEALNRLYADAGSTVDVHRDPDGRVDFVAAAGGVGIVNPMLRGQPTPAAAAYAHLDRYGEMLGLDGRSTVEWMSTRRSGSGATTVRYQQLVDGVPVVGGELVVSLDETGGLTSILAETTPSTSAGASAPSTSTAGSAPSVSEAEARATAIAATAKYRRVRPAALRAVSAGRWLYDPRLIDSADLLGTRPVWRFEVTNGVDVREFVLVDAMTGRIALTFSQITNALNRAICDNNDVRRAADVPCTSGFARVEGDPATGDPDVDNAYDFTGATAALYDAVDNVDLTELIGVGAAGSRRLTSTVRWCYRSAECPYANAFWNGIQMYYGRGYARADDVVGHELTHGYIEKTSNLLYFYQSGAINESMSDVIGEIVDHRRTTDNDDGWLLAEDLPGPPIRNLRNPPASDQPDKMRSTKWVTDPFIHFGDNGGVHTNSGVGNKTAYLISQGGTFNGRRIVGIDGANRALTKTAHLYVDAAASLTSGSDYADLGRVLAATCDRYVARGEFGFTARNCTNVRRAVLATELALQPVSAAAQAPEAPASCPPGTFRRLLYRDNVDNSGKPWTRGALWTDAPGTVQGYEIPASATSGKRSYFGLNSDPFLDEPATSFLTSRSRVRLPAGQQSFLRFRHWYLFEHRLPSSAPFYDGGVVSVRAGNGPFQGTASRRWVNGPTRNVAVAPQRAFAGSSHGYQSSRLNLSWLAGKRIQPRFGVFNDQEIGFYGWYIDDIAIYTCPRVRPSAASSNG